MSPAWLAFVAGFISALFALGMVLVLLQAIDDLRTARILARGLGYRRDGGWRKRNAREIQVVIPNRRREPTC